MNLTEKGIELLVKVENVDTFEDGRFYVKRARDISRESVIEIDKCSVADYEDDVAVNNEQNNTLSDIQSEQLKLKQQQEALKLKEEQLKTKLAEQKEKELSLKKKQLILSYQTAIASNIKTYNETLKICNCNHETLNYTESSGVLSSKSLEYIKRHYNSSIKTLASNYLSQLNLCKE